MMKARQISLTIPEVLLKESEEHSKEYGYKTVQEFILDVLRKKLIIENVERYRQIELEMITSGKKMSQKQALDYLDRL
ncbi:MAG: hypothetical protein V1911_00140 [Candidatus Micrarchaeota archaeon]